MMKRDPIQELKLFANQLEVAIGNLAKEHGVEHLGGPQGHAVSYLYQHQDKEVFIKDIEREQQVSKSVASNLIKRMEKNGFVEIVPSKNDKRYKHVQLTAFGLKKAEKLHAFIQEMEKTIFKGLSREDFDHIRRVVAQIRTNLASGKQE